VTKKQVSPTRSRQRRQPGPPPDPLGFICPNPAHRGGQVRGRGERTKKNGTVLRRLYCIPPVGDPHYFEVDVRGPVRSAPVLPEGCPRHPDSKVTRMGTYSSAGIPRQRYRCTPDDGAKVHSFTPVLPRQQQVGGEECAECAEHGHILRGDTVAGRQQWYSTHQVAEGLIQLSRGSSYAAVGERARLDRLAAIEAANRHRELTHPDAKTRSVHRFGTDHASTWRLPAAWVERYSPLLFDPWATTQTDAALAAIADGGVPRVVMVDDKPIYSKSRTTRAGRKKMLFSLIVAVEVLLDDDGTHRTNRVRLIRAMPTHQADAYRLVLAELGYIPDVVISDGSHSARSAVEWLMQRGEAEGRSVTWMLSHHHVQEQLQRAMANLAAPTKKKGEKDAPKAFSVPRHISDDLASMYLLTSIKRWNGWWQRLVRALTAQGIEESRHPMKWWNDYAEVVVEGMRYRKVWPGIPASTGALEAILATSISPLLEGRSEAMGNIARTNQLLDLVTLQLNGQLNHADWVAERIRADAVANGGYALRQRHLTDPGHYRSLRDETLPNRLVLEQGLR